MDTKWISVIKELPPIDTLVLVCWYPYESKKLGKVRMAALAPPLDEGRWLTAYWCEDIRRGAFAHPYNEDGTVSDKEVSYWQHLPKLL